MDTGVGSAKDSRWMGGATKKGRKKRWVAQQDVETGKTKRGNERKR